MADPRAGQLCDRLGQQATGHVDTGLVACSPVESLVVVYGGGIPWARDVEIRHEMLRLAAGMPMQRRTDQLRRLVKFGLLNALASPRAFGLAVRTLDLVGPGHDAMLQRLTRGFPGPGLLARVRRRPSAPLVRTLPNTLTGSSRCPPRTRRHWSTISLAQVFMRPKGVRSMWSNTIIPTMGRRRWARVTCWNMRCISRSIRPCRTECSTVSLRQSPANCSGKVQESSDAGHSMTNQRPPTPMKCLDDIHSHAEFAHGAAR